MDMLFNITIRQNKVTTTLYLKEIERISPVQSAAASHKKLKGSLDTRGIAETCSSKDDYNTESNHWTIHV